MFTTQDLIFASWIHCTDRLRFLRCESNELGRVTFIFSDPEDRGEGLLAEFAKGPDGVHIREFYDSIRHFRSLMNRRRKETDYYGRK